jgi:hypothetical protein
MTQWQTIDHLLLQLNDQVSLLEKQELREQLVFFINYLLLNDFDKLVRILYTVDVNEEKLKTILQDNPQTDAAEIITNLLIQRQQQKIETKQAFKKDTDISEEDGW